MPSYDYVCRRCSERFQAHHAIGAVRPTCPICGGEVQRVFLSAPAVHGNMARGRDRAVRSLDPTAVDGAHGPRCPCCH